MARFLQEPSKNGTKELALTPLDAAAFGEAFPALFEFMSLARWESGKARILGSLTLFMEQGLVKCCVSDKDARLMAFVGASGLVEVLEEVEKQLAEGCVSWRQARDRSGR